MFRRKRGRAVIINNKYFVKYQVRDGCEKDVEDLENLFTKIHFIVEVHKDKTAQVIFLLFHSINQSNQIKIYIAPYVHEDSEALGGWITCSRRVGIDEFLNVFFERQ